MAHHNAHLFDLGPQNMFRIIRSARSRLAREQSTEPREDDRSRTTVSQASSTQVTGDRVSKRSSLSRSAFSRHRVSRTSTAGPCSSENAAPEKVPQPPTHGGSVLGDVTNTTTMTSGILTHAGDSESHAAKLALSRGFTLQKPSVAQEPHSTAASLVGTSDQYECDVLHAADPQRCFEYLADIYRTLQREESHPNPSYMDRQAHVNAKMRGILVDWLVSVQQKYKLRTETLFLAVSITDRYLEKQVTARSNLQLVGITSLLIAAKFEEIHPPHVNDFVFVTDKAYSREEIVKMEVLILGALDFKVCEPTPMVFLERYQFVNGCSDSHKHLSQYLLELTLVDYSMIKYSPSHLAAAAVLLSNKLQRRQPSWSPEIVKQTRFTEHMLRECAKEMCALLEYADQNSLQAVRKKFSQPKYNSVAKTNFAGPPSAPSSTEEDHAPASRSVVASERRPLV